MLFSAMVVSVSPTVLFCGPYRFYFFLNEGNEPPHVHVQEGKKSAKFWLTPVSLATSRHFAAHELADLTRIVKGNQERFQEAWDGRFGRTV